MSSSNFYKLFKTNLKQSEYSRQLPNSLCKTLIPFRTRHPKLPVETGRMRSIALNERLCQHCQSDIGDEYHYLLVCDYFNAMRRKNIKHYFFQ